MWDYCLILWLSRIFRLWHNWQCKSHPHSKSWSLIHYLFISIFQLTLHWLCSKYITVCILICSWWDLKQNKLCCYINSGLKLRSMHNNRPSIQKGQISSSLLGFWKDDHGDFCLPTGNSSRCFRIPGSTLLPEAVSQRCASAPPYSSVLCQAEQIFVWKLSTKFPQHCKRNNDQMLSYRILWPSGSQAWTSSGPSSGQPSDSTQRP